jgi:hypothetical protein
VREHFYAGLDYQNKLVRFLENHDEPRAAATFDQQNHEAAAVITFLSPGLRFFHQGQFEGRKKRISPHLIRAPQEPLDEALLRFYTEFLSILTKSIFRDGQWSRLECVPVWEGNSTWDCFIVFAWEGTDGGRVLVSVNYAPHASQCFVHLPFPDMAGLSIQFKDLMSSALYDRNGSELLSRGLYLDLKAWGYHIFEVSVPAKNSSAEIDAKTGTNTTKKIRSVSGRKRTESTKNVRRKF